MHNEKLYTLIKSPIVTEKSARVGETLKQIVFKVDLNSNKREIKKAVEELRKVNWKQTKTTEMKQPYVGEILKLKEQIQQLQAEKEELYQLLCVVFPR